MSMSSDLCYLNHEKALHQISFNGQMVPTVSYIYIARLLLRTDVKSVWVYRTDQNLVGIAIGAPNGANKLVKV